jgi:DNA-binding FadR family transcriptional regulator
MRVQLEDLLWLHSAGEHDDIVRAVMAGNPDDAREAMAIHSQSFGNEFIRLEKTNGSQKAQMPGLFCYSAS